MLGANPTLSVMFSKPASRSYPLYSLTAVTGIKRSLTLVSAQAAQIFLTFETFSPARVIKNG
jgi:hypothetical protein